MDRRGFLVAAAAAAILRKLPLQQGYVRRFIPFNLGTIYPAKLAPVKFELGYKISEELIQDDLYGL